MKANDRATILVIDDDAEMTEMLGEYLEPRGSRLKPGMTAIPGCNGRSKASAC